MLRILNDIIVHWVPNYQRNCTKLDEHKKLIQNYLDAPEIDEELNIKQDKKDDKVEVENGYAINIDNHSFSWGLKTRNDIEEELERRKNLPEDLLKIEEILDKRVFCFDLHFAVNELNLFFSISFNRLSEFLK